MTNKDLEIMRKLIEAQKEKSAQQSGNYKHDKKIGDKRTAVKKYKKSGLFDK